MAAAFSYTPHFCTGGSSSVYSSGQQHFKFKPPRTFSVFASAFVENDSVVTLLDYGAGNVRECQKCHSLSRLQHQRWIQLEKTVLQSRVMEDPQESLKLLLARLVRGEDRKKLETTGFACHNSTHSLVCVSNEGVKINTMGNNITVLRHIASNQSSMSVEEETVVKPYARQDMQQFLQFIKPVEILGGNDPVSLPDCQFNHKVPAVIFSSALVGNAYHEMGEIIIPLFITTRQFKSRVVLILDDYRPSFVAKYIQIFSRLSDYEVMDPAASRSIHCFPGLVVGLKYHDILAIDSSKIPGGYKMSDFRKFLKESFSLKFSHVSQIKKPTLTLISRDKTRRILNEEEMVSMMKELGFRVIVARDEMTSNLTKFSKIINSCSMLVGAHGAGLTNELFLPDGGVVVQMELLGLEYPSTHCYGNPARGMDLHYVQYKIEPQESTLVELYGRNHTIVVDPGSIIAKGGNQAVKDVYQDQQNVRLNIARFRETLVRAFQLITNSSFHGKDDTTS